MSNNRTTASFVTVALFLSLPSLAKSGTIYVQTDLVSDVPGLAVTTDSNLVNPWGISNSATSPYWISDQGTGVSTLYNGAGTPTALVVTVPAGGGPPSGPTGTVFNNTGGGFLVGGSSANFIFGTLSGTIAARATGSTATTEATVSGAVFTGLAIGTSSAGSTLYAADFVTGGGIQAFNSSFAPITLTGSFANPNLPAGYAPYNIQNIGGDLYVEYAEVGTGGPDVGAGLGFVAVFDENGNFIQELASGGTLDAPWGIALAPSGFGSFSNDLLVGNFGNGEINAFNPTTGAYIGTIDGPGGTPLVNDDLWALEFGNGNAGSSPNTLYFTAGIDNQTEGLFGEIQATPEPASVMLFAAGFLGIAAAIRRRSA